MYSNYGGICIRDIGSVFYDILSSAVDTKQENGYALEYLNPVLKYCQRFNTHDCLLGIGICACDVTNPWKKNKSVNKKNASKVKNNIDSDE